MRADGQHFEHLFELVTRLKTSWTN